MNNKKGNVLAIGICFFLFAMISFVTGLQNPMGIIAKAQFGATNFMSQLGNAANFIAYAFLGLPAGFLLKGKGYKFTALAAVSVGFIGVGISYLSGILGSFVVYLLGAFVSGFSMCMLNTVVNPMLNTLGGGGNRGNQLVQIGGTFNSLTGTLTPMLVGALIGAVTADTQIADVNTVLFIAMGVFAATFAVLIFVPFVEPEQDQSNASVKSLFQYRHLVFGVIAIFLYVGVEIGIPGTLNFFLADSEKGAGLDPSTAASIAGSVAAMYWLLMLCGRFISSFISGKVSSRMQLGVTSGAAIIFVLIAMFTSEVSISMPVLKGFSEGFAIMTLPLSALFLVICGLCTSVMWGTIFNLSVEGLGKQSALASGLFMTMVVGGGVLPLIQNAIADAASYMVSYWVVVAALAYICWFAFLGSKVKKA